MFAAPTSRQEISAHGAVKLLEGLLDEEMTLDSAKRILDWAFSPAELDRMHALADKNQESPITPEEHQELMAYTEAVDLLTILQSQARKRLGRGDSHHGQPNGIAKSKTAKVS